MKAFAVLVNGQKVAIIGIGHKGLLSAIVNWVPGRSEEIGGEFFMQLGGLDSAAGHDGEHVTWQTPTLSLGDEVTILLVNTEDADPPTQRKAIHPASPDLLVQAGISIETE